MNGGHGQIVQQHAVKESKQEPEHVRMMLQTLASPSLSKKVVPFLQLIGGHGQTVLQHAVMVSRQEQEHVLTFKKFPPIIQKTGQRTCLYMQECCNETWTTWSAWDSCSDRGAGPYKKQRSRRKFVQAACSQEGKSVQTENETQDCSWTGDWGTGKLKNKSELET